MWYLAPHPRGWQVHHRTRRLRRQPVFYDRMEAQRHMLRLAGIALTHDDEPWNVMSDAIDCYLEDQLWISPPTTCERSSTTTILDMSETHSSHSCPQLECRMTRSCSCSTKDSGISTLISV